MDFSYKDTIDLVTKAQADDPAALEALFTRYLPRVRRIAAVRLGRTARALFDVDDIVQESMTDAFRNLDSFQVDSESRFCNWLSRIVENRLRMEFRSERAAKRGGGAVRAFSDQQSSVHGSRIAGPDATPSQFAQAGETDERIEAALLELPKRNREVIVHRLFCKMSFAEVAAEMGFDNENVARAAYSRALAALGERIDAD